MKYLFIIALSFTLLACGKDKKSEKTELISSNKNITTQSEQTNKNWITMKPDSESLNKNKFKTGGDSGFFSNKEALERFRFLHSLGSESKLTFLKYQYDGGKQKWIYRINSTNRKGVAYVKVCEGTKKKKSQSYIEREIIPRTKL